MRELGEETKRRLEEKYLVKVDELEPHVYYRLTDRIELTLRFLFPDAESR